MTGEKEFMYIRQLGPMARNDAESTPPVPVHELSLSQYPIVSRLECPHPFGSGG